MAFAVSRLSEFLTGRWSLTRQMTDLTGGGHGSLTGTADFTSLGTAEAAVLRSAGHDAAAGLRQHESGRLTWTDSDGAVRDGTAVRTYLLLPTDHAAAMDVFFDDGRPFHRLDLRTGSWQATHACAPDDYGLDFQVVSADRIDYRWRVRGPAKDLVLTSRLIRR